MSGTEHDLYVLAAQRAVPIYRRIGHAGSFTCRAVAQKPETQNEKEDQISIRTTPDNAESEVFSDSRRFFYDFFLEKVTLYGEVAIKSR